MRQVRDDLILEPPKRRIKTLVLVVVPIISLLIFFFVPVVPVNKPLDCLKGYVPPIQYVIAFVRGTTVGVAWLPYLNYVMC